MGENTSSSLWIRIMPSEPAFDRNLTLRVEHRPSAGYGYVFAKEETLLE
jgi:hypothetical protein